MKILFFILTAIVLSNASCVKKDSPKNVPSESIPVVIDALRSEGTSTNVGSGGNGAEAQWKQVAQDLAENIRLLNTSKVDPKIFDIIKSKFSEVVKNAKVEFKDYPLIYGHETADTDNPLNEKNSTATDCQNVNLGNDHRERDAINFNGSSKIKVNRIRFNCYPKNGLEISRLVLHEYLGLLGLDEKQGSATNYVITNALIAEFKQIHRFETGLQKIEIETCDQLQNVGQETPPEGDVRLGESSYPYAYRPRRIWVLANDLDCQNTKTKFHNLTGHFNGNGYTIKNLKIISTPNEGSALFKSNCSQCIIANLHIENAVIHGRAILIGSNHGKIMNTRVSGKISVDRSTAGGLAVYNNFGTISGSRADVSFVSQEPGKPIMEIGGLVCGNYQGVISNSQAKITIENGDDRVGGIAAINNVGEIRGATTIVDFKVDASTTAGGIVGLNTGLIADSHAEGKIVITSDRQSFKSDLKMNGVAGLSFDSPSEAIEKGLKELNRNEYPPAQVESSSAEVEIIKD